MQQTRLHRFCDSGIKETKMTDNKGDNQGVAKVQDQGVQTEPNGTDKPYSRIGPKGSGPIHGGEAAKPGQLPHDQDVGPKD